MTDLDKRLADAASEPPPPTLRARVFGPRPRRVPWLVLAAAGLLFAVTIAVVFRTDRPAATAPRFARLGETGVFWATPEGLDSLSRDGSLAEARDVVLVLVRIEGDRALSSDIMVAKFGEERRMEHWWYSPGTTYSHDHAMEGGWAKGGEILRGCSRVRGSSIVFAAPYARPDTPGLRSGLEEALKHPRRDVRAAAAHAMRRFYDVRAVESVLALVKDPDPLVRHAARDTMVALVAAPRCDTRENCCESHDFPKWWAALDDEQRRDLLALQWSEELETITDPCKK